MILNRPLTVESIVQLGFLLRDLQECKEEDLLYSEAKPLGIIQKVEYLQRLLTRLELRGAEGVVQFQVRPTLRELKRYHNHGALILGNKYANQLSQSIQPLWEKVDFEARQKLAFPIRQTSSSIYLAEHFVDIPERLFGLTFVLQPDDLPPAVQSNLIEAGRCLAVGFAPAAILFTCLATEVIVKYYYKQLTGEEPKTDKGQPMTWGQINHSLDEKNLCPTGLIQDLKSIVVNYRNGAMHATLDYYDGVEVDVWNLCRDTVQQMIDDLESKGIVTRVEL
ncbi:MAG: hypothetical protein L0322_18690 [Chloroflexi bacterium]|nr:hypothetical protein [Chloroflexota bacterium]MCI0580857.1 hypothetical protein [Chloroflexota bacterium]